jgi:hypothetical protein
MARLVTGIYKDKKLGRMFRCTEWAAVLFGAVQAAKESKQSLQCRDSGCTPQFDGRPSPANMDLRRYATHT